MGKFVSLSKLAESVTNGSSITMGGSLLHRGPFAFCRELSRQKKKDLVFVKPSPGYDLDLLCATGSIKESKVGIVLMESGYGLAPNYRKAIENNNVKLEEHACATILAGMRAAASGIPFQPVAGLEGSEIPEVNRWEKMQNPYSEDTDEVYVIPAIQPDVAVIHASEVDEDGNVKVKGSLYWDRIMSRAAKRVLITAEKIVSRNEFTAHPEQTLIPAFMVESIAITPKGAWPGNCYPDYEIDEEALEEYLNLSKTNKSLTPHFNRAPEINNKEVNLS